MAFLDLLAQSPLATGGILLLAVLLFYLIYQRHLHPLAKYPGPFLASLTDLWQVHQFLSLQQPYNLTKLHERYGPIVRYGPDKLSLTHESAILIIYQKSGRSMPKTEFYDAYGAAHPNVFGMRDESMHSTRRRHMSHSFSASYVKEMEKYLDLNIAILKAKIHAYATTGQAFDLKKFLHYYVIDVLGELAFSQSFGVQEADDESLVPPVLEHSLLAAVTGAWPAMTMRLRRWLPYVPHGGLQKLLAGRKACADLASACVQRRLKGLEKAGEGGGGEERKDILTNLIKAKHPETGARLTPIELETEAFGFIIAGTHTTSATTTLLFYHLLHNPEWMQQCVAEVDANLPRLNLEEAAYPVSAAESSLPLLRNCMRENFRITPVFTMPLARRVTNPAGVTIDGEWFPKGTSLAVCNHAFHHNPTVWGADHNTFNPMRWEDPAVNAKARLLMHFGLGGRQCVGKTVATTNILKVVSTLLREFSFELADQDGGEREGRDDCRIGEVNVGSPMPELVSVGISDLKGGLFVRARAR
ncbi:cytochrome P450 [Aspergillus germanicus]